MEGERWFVRPTILILLVLKIVVKSLTLGGALILSIWKGFPSFKKTETFGRVFPSLKQERFTREHLCRSWLNGKECQSFLFLSFTHECTLTLPHLITHTHTHTHTHSLANTHHSFQSRFSRTSHVICNFRVSVVETHKPTLWVSTTVTRKLQSYSLLQICWGTIKCTLLAVERLIDLVSDYTLCCVCKIW